MEMRVPMKFNRLFSFCKLLIASYLITGILLLLLAMILYKFRISDDMVNIGIIVIYCLSTFFTGFLAGKAMQQKKFLWGFLLGSAYFLLLCLISIVIHQNVEPVSGSLITTFFLCSGSGMLGGMIS